MAVSLIVFNVVVVGGAASAALDHLGAGEWLFAGETCRYPPNVAIDVGLFVVLHDIFFGCIHHSLHRFAYRGIHKVHHQFVVPHPMVAFYAHPLEHLLTAIAPTSLSAAALALIIRPACLQSAVLFVFAGTFNTVAYAHDGRRLLDWHVRHHRRGGRAYGNWPYVYDFLVGLCSARRAPEHNGRGSGNGGGR
jgi:sterol desaturase/sphingolipid hydroxylase (fatty acid hydroxylase superfamily)